MLAVSQYYVSKSKPNLKIFYFIVIKNLNDKIYIHADKIQVHT